MSEVRLICAEIEMNGAGTNKLCLTTRFNLNPPAEFRSTLILSLQQAANITTEVTAINRSELIVVVFWDVVHFPLDGATLILGTYGSGCEKDSCRCSAEHNSLS